MRVSKHVGYALLLIYIQGVLGGIVNILGGVSLDYS